VHEDQGQVLYLRHERDGASRAAYAGEPHQLAVLGMTAGRLRRRRAPPSDRLDRLERLENFRHVYAEPLALRIPAGGFDDLTRAEAESQAAGDGQRVEAAPQAGGVVVRRDEGVQLLLLLAD